MTATDIPAPGSLLTAQQVRDLAGIKRTAWHQLKVDGKGPRAAVDIDGRRERFSAYDVLYWLAGRGLVEQTELPGIDPVPGLPPEQRYRFDAARGPEAVNLPHSRWFGDDDAAECVLYRYTSLGRRDYTLTVVLGLDRDPFAWGLTREAAEAMGYGPDGLHGCIATCDGSRDHGHLDLIKSHEVPDDWSDAEEQHGIRLQLQQQPSVVATLLGHRLPHWPGGAISRQAALAWRPDTTVDAGIPQAFERHREIRLGCRAALDEIADGTRPDPGTNVKEALAHLGNVAWDSGIGQVFVSERYSEKRPHGWAAAITVPPKSTEEKHPLLPVQPHSIDWTTATEWLATQTNLPRNVAHRAIDYFGYPSSLSIAAIDLVQLRNRSDLDLTQALTPAEYHKDWAHQAILDKCSNDDEISWWAWTTDPDPQSHPVALVNDTTLLYHVPRVLFPDARQRQEAILLAATDYRQRRYVGGFVRTYSGALIPLPLPPLIVDTHTGHIGNNATSGASVLTAIALGVTEPVSLANLTRLTYPPEELTRIAAGMTTARYLEIPWTTVTSAIAGFSYEPPDDIESTYMRDKAILDAFDEHNDPWKTPEQITP